MAFPMGHRPLSTGYKPLSMNHTPPPKINLPTILIEDWTALPALTTRYICGPNNLETKPLYRHLKALLAFPKCRHTHHIYGIDSDQEDEETLWPCMDCETTFSESFWASAAQLLDYFAEFITLDSPAMHSVWFHMYDMWQECALWLPCEYVLESAAEVLQPWITDEVGKRAKKFNDAFHETLGLVDTAIFGPVRKGFGQKKKIVAPADRILIPPSGRTVGDMEGDYYETGPWISGLKPWQQFLAAGSPGVATDSSTGTEKHGNDAKSYLQSLILALSQLEDQAKLGLLPKRLPPPRHVPMAALAIIHRHTARARNFAVMHSTTLPGDTSREDFITAFDNNSLSFPLRNRSHTYTSLTGKTTTYTLRNGAPPISRPLSLGDSHLISEAPSVQLLDEAVGMCKGVEGYRAMSGIQVEEEEEEDDDEDEDEDENEDEDGDGNGGEEEEDEDDSMETEDGDHAAEEDDDEEPFDVWVVRELERSGGDEVVEGLGDMFDEWVWEERERGH